MNPNIIEIESAIDSLRHELPNTKDLEEASVLLCRAQNIMQKHIEKNYPVSEWVHYKTHCTKGFTGQLASGDE